MIAVRLSLARGLLHDLGEGDQLLEQLDVLGRGERGQVEIAGHALGRPLGGAEDPAQARVRHLHVEDRVLVGLPLGEVDVEIERASRPCA